MYISQLQSLLYAATPPQKPFHKTFSVVSASIKQPFFSELYVNKKITYHDSCYLGRANNIYEAPRKVLEALDVELVEMKRCRSNGLCCGAGGAQMFKEEEKGEVRINTERTREALETAATIIAANCPFCMTMLTDGVKVNEKEDEVKVLDIAEMIVADMV